MTAHSQKTKQKRLRSCVLSQLRWAKIRKKAQHHDQVAIKINDLVAKTAARVENTLEFSQKQHNTTLLGKYPFIYLGQVRVVVPVLAVSCPLPRRHCLFTN